MEPTTENPLSQTPHHYIYLYDCIQDIPAALNDSFLQEVYNSQQEFAGFVWHGPGDEKVAIEYEKRANEMRNQGATFESVLISLRCSENHRTIPQRFNRTSDANFKKDYSKLWAAVFTIIGGIVSFFLVEALRFLYYFVLIFVLIFFCCDLITIASKAEKLASSFQEDQDKILLRCSIPGWYEFFGNYPKSAAFLAGFILIGFLKLFSNLPL